MAATMYPHMYCEGGGHNHESLPMDAHAPHIYIYIYIHTYTFIHTHAHTYIHTCIYTNTIYIHT